MRAVTCFIVLLLLHAPRLNATALPAATYAQRRAMLQQRSIAVLTDEISTEKADACSVPANTAETSRCRRQATAGTIANYNTYAAGISALLRLQPPDSTPPEIEDAQANRRNFRIAESLWVRYRDTQCEAVQTMSCVQELTRHHLRELAGLYERLF